MPLYYPFIRLYYEIALLVQYAGIDTLEYVGIGGEKMIEMAVEIATIFIVLSLLVVVLGVIAYLRQRD